MKRMFWKHLSLGVLGMLGSAGTILADAFFVSWRLGAEGLAAMNLAICVFGLLNGTGLLLGVGGATRYTILRAQGDAGRAGTVFTQSLLTALAAAAAYALAGLCFAGPLARFLGAGPDTWDLCTRYLRTVLCFAPAFVGNHLLMAFVRNDGAPGLAMGSMLTASFANIVLDYLFLVPLGWGITGAALATGLSAILGIAVSSLHFLSRDNGLRFVPARLTLRDLGALAGPGVAACLTEASSGAVLAVCNGLLLRTAGTVGVAAYGIVANLALMILAVLGGMAQGLQPLLSHSHGRGEGEAARSLYRRGVLLATGLGLAVWAAAAAWAPELVGCFNGAGEQLLQSLSETGLRLYFPGFLFAGLNCLTAAYWSATEKPRRALSIAVFRGFVGITAAAVVLSHRLGLAGVFLAFPVTEALTALGCLRRRA